MKVLFLDIDGVLNWAGTQERYNGFIGLDPSRIARFNRIIEAHPDVKIVISSTWRKTASFIEDGFDGLVKLLADNGLKGEIIGHTIITFSHMPRGSEIRDWLEDYQEENDGQLPTFVILDDDTQGMAGYVSVPYGEGPKVHLDLRPYHVITDWMGDPNFVGKGPEGADEEGGLQDRHIDQAIAVLNGVLIPIEESRDESFDLAAE